MFKEPNYQELISVFECFNEWHNWKVDADSSILSKLVTELSKREMNEMLCHESTGCKAGNNDDFYRRRQRQTFNTGP